MRSFDVLCALSFLWLSVFMYWGAEWLVWVFLAPFIVLSIRCSLRGIFVAGSIAVILTGYLWLEWLHLYDPRILLIGLASFYLFFMFVALVTRTLSRRKGVPHVSWHFVLIPPTVWFCTAKIFSYTSIGSCWTDLAMFQSEMAPLIWVVGAKGVTFIIVLFNSLIAAWLLRRSNAIAMVGMLSLIIIGSCLAYSNFGSMGGKSIKISLLQGNFPQSWKWREEQAQKIIINTYLDITKEVKDERPDIIAWPEYAIPDDVLQNKHLLDRIEIAAKDAGSYLVLGTLEKLGGTINGKPRTHNLALVISPKPETIPHDKYVSVQPIPFDKWTIPGPQTRTMATEKAKLGILLCFEETLPEIAAEISQQGAEMFLSLSNNSHLKQSKGIYLASLQTKLRAAENAKFVARVTNTGVTQVINPFGKIIAKAEPFSREILTSEVRLSSWVTPYSQYGDRLLMIILFTVWCFVWVSKLGAKRKAQRA